jgi:type III restriction enzyme
VITGDNYESGVGVRDEGKLKMGIGVQPDLFRPGGEDAVHINVFNISKFNKDTKTRKGSSRMRKISEYIGESYFEYLTSLPDLVVLMDEAHRYRAKAGTRAINELKPILGLELTATPFIESSKGPVFFKNTIYEYPLAKAIDDGFVKKPAVATRADFMVSNHSKEEVERIKIEDGIRLHEEVKADLQVYASEHGHRAVKPFMLLIASDTTHASRLLDRFRSKEFFDGQYADKVIEVHSAQKGEEKEETIERLIAVENPDEPTEIVIHVNMLKEGWDVTNLFTIVPLRAAKARTLVEQSMGRGLRLPYGRRTGVAAVDRLTIVAHDKFQEIVDEANRGDSILRRMETIELGPTDLKDTPKAIEIKPAIEDLLTGPAVPSQGEASQGSLLRLLPQGDSDPRPRPVFETPRSKDVARAVLQRIATKTSLRSAQSLLTPEHQRRLVEEVKAVLPPQQELGDQKETVAEIVKKATQLYVENSIDIPAISVVPTGEVSICFGDFDLNLRGWPALQPITKDILVQNLRTGEQQTVSMGDAANREKRLEDYIVSALIDFDDVDYDSTSDLLYKLATQLVKHLGSYLKTEDDVRNVLMYNPKQLGKLVHTQMREHRQEMATGYEVKLLSGHRPLKPETIQVRPSEDVRPFREPVVEKNRIAQMVFGGFSKCLFWVQKFHSDAERQFAVLLERDSDALRWVKPARKNFQIQLKGGSLYEPDFVVEGVTVRYLCEVKQANQVDQPEVIAKAEAASTWCKHATDCGGHGSKPWKYLLIPANMIQANSSLRFLADHHEYTPKVESTLVGAVPTRGTVIPFRKLDVAEVKPFKNCVPVYDLKIAAGKFSDEQVVDEVLSENEVANPEDFTWASFRATSTRPRRGLFIAQVEGTSMNNKIPSGSWCLWNIDQDCQGEGAEIVLAQHRGVHDSDLGGGFTVKYYEKTESIDDDGRLSTTAVTLRPSSTDSSHQPLVIAGPADGDLNIIAELVEVLG